MNKAISMLHLLSRADHLMSHDMAWKRYHHHVKAFMQGCPPVDILIRTSGESRLSDFLLWQSGTAQLQFTDVLWPEFSFWDLLKALVLWQLARPDLERIGQAAERRRQTHAYS